MTEQTPTSYTEQHPEAVQNIEQAHTMAMAGDVHESHVANMRQKIASELGAAVVDTEWGASLSAGDGRQPLRQKVSGIVSQINKEKRDVDGLYKGIGSAYEEIQATKR